MATAEALGLPAEVLDSARRRLARGAEEMEALLQGLRKEREAARADREEARAALEAARGRERELADRLSGLDRERREVLKGAHEEAAGILREYREEGEKALARIQEIRKEKPAPGARDRARVEQKRLEELGRRSASEVRRLAPEPPGAVSEPVREGQTVALRTMGGFGTVRRIDAKKGRAEVAMGVMAFEVDLADLIPVKGEERPAAAPRAALERPLDVPRELHLIGMRVEEALEVLRKYLDDAVLSNRDEVRVVHGFGTGALQKAVHEFLRRHSSVASFRFGEKHEGSEGATVVRLQ
jgi:DNA mismatch repair protein MutS2